jgi:hypothetical protein
MLPQLQKDLLRDILRGLRIAQVAAQEALQARGVLAVEPPKGFCFPASVCPTIPVHLPPVPWFLFLFAAVAQKVH